MYEDMKMTTVYVQAVIHKDWLPNSWVEIPNLINVVEIFPIGMYCKSPFPLALGFELCLY